MLKPGVFVELSSYARCSMASALVANDPMRSATPAEVTLARSVQDHLGEELRAVYGRLRGLPLPKDLRLLVARFERVVQASGEQVDPEFRRGLISALPNLRYFALSLTRDSELAADLVQDTILRAWDKRGL